MLLVDEHAAARDAIYATFVTGVALETLVTRRRGNRRPAPSSDHGTGGILVARGHARLLPGVW